MVRQQICTSCFKLCWHRTFRENTAMSVASKNYINVKRPAIVKEYNSSMDAIDLQNMLVELYRIDFKSKLYYLRNIFHSIDMCVVNSWLLYRRKCKILNQKVKALIDFKTEIAFTLMQSGKGINKRGRPSSTTLRVQKQVKRKRIAHSLDSVRSEELNHRLLPQKSSI